MPRRMPSTVEPGPARARGRWRCNPVELLRTVPRSLRYVDRLPGAANSPGTQLLSGAAALVGRVLGGRPRADARRRELRAPAHPAERHDHRAPALRVRLAAARDVKLVKNHFGMTVNDVVMALTAAALRRWLLDHDALPDDAAGRARCRSRSAPRTRPARTATRSR